MTGYTLDTGALIALERRSRSATGFLRVAREDGATVTAPANVVAEWRRKRTDLREAILEAIRVEPMEQSLARLVGETLAQVRGASLVDATVMASAARRGDTVLTADLEDLQRLAAHFPEVRVLRV